MELHEEQVGGVKALAVRGRLDSASAPDLDGRLQAAMAAPGSRLVVDFTRLDYISSAGFRTLLVAAKAAESEGRRLILCGLTGPVRQLFDIGGFLQLFTIAHSRDEAITLAR
jgi:anti-sigma B factor antagonist